MKSLFAVLAVVAAFAFATPVLADGENPCGNHGNHCCTDDAGQSYVAVEDECNAFCTSTAQAVSVATSECEAKASAKCSQECEGSVAEAVAQSYAECEAGAEAACAQTCGTQVAAAVADATAACAQTCSVPICLKWRIKRNAQGLAVSKICKQTSEQPITAADAQ